MSLKFVSLHNHSGFSLYDGIGSTEDIANWVIRNAGADGGAFAQTDHGSCSGAGSIAAAQKKLKDKIRIFYGTESYYLPSLKDWATLKQQREEAKKEEKEIETSDLVIENEAESKGKYFDPLNRRNHLVLVAQNQVGLKNLFRLVSRSYKEGMYRKPRIDFEMLKKYNEGLIASTACIAGIPSWCSQQEEQNPFSLYDQELLPLMELFGKDRFFLELQFNKLPVQQLVNKHLIEYAQRTGYKLIVTADSHYPSPDMWRDREIYRLLGHQMQKKNADMSVLDKTIDELECELYLKNGDQIFQAYKQTFGKQFTDDKLIIEAIERTYDIAHNFIENVHPDDTIKLPKTFQVSDKIKTAFDQLKAYCLEGLKKKGLTSQEYIDRTAYELKIIKKLGFEEYFLTVREILNVLRKHMLTGAGRGSSCGSMVCYLTNITFIDPIKNGLLFERFVSPSRKELADVDSDIPDREQAFKIIQEHFGEENVLAISNYNRLQLKSLIKDISRLYGIDFQEVNNVTKIIEDEAKSKIMDEIDHDQKLYQLTFEKAKQYSPTFIKFLEKYPDIGKHIENLYQEIKSIGKHAGGTIIVPNADECLPVIKIRGTFQSPITEGITAQHLKYFGLVKVDVLSLATLKVIEKCIQEILKSKGNVNPTIEDMWMFYNEYLHPDVINPEDPKIFEKVYKKGMFLGVFQFAEKGVQKFCKRSIPTKVKEIAAITSLFRPGPLKGKADKRYLKFKKSELEKEHPILQEVLGETRLCLLYQETFMLLANKLAGFTLEEADNLRKLLVKPATSLSEEMKKERIEVGKKFIEGCIKSGLTDQRAKHLWNKEILGFISYGFSKNHAIPYSYNSYQCAYLLTYHEKEWVKACLECDPDLQETINNVRLLGYEIAKPDVNHSSLEWVVGDGICFPSLLSLKGVGDVAAEELVRRRGMGFKDINDFFFTSEGEWRWNKLNKKCLEVLIKTGGFESLNCVGAGGIFKTNKHFFDTLEQYGDKLRKKKITLEEAAKQTEVSDWTTKEVFEFQKEIVGFYDKVAYLRKFEKVFKEFDIQAIDEVEDNKNKTNVWAIIEDCIQKKTKTGKPYLQIKCSGRTEKMYEFRVWDQMKTKDWEVANVIILDLKYDEYGFSLPRNHNVTVL